MIVRRHRCAALLAAAALLPTAVACRFEPSAPPLNYSLNRAAVEENEELASNPAAQARIEGTLQMLFGTPQAPGYLVASEWADDEFEPNYWGEDHVFGDEAATKALIESNRAAYRTQIAALRAGDWEGVVRPRFADDLWARWLELKPELQEKPDAAGENGTLRDDAVRMFEEYYPSLANSAAFYRNQCYHCHGASGGGDGSTSEFLEPRPRDYRPGKFKFTALKSKSRPRHEDLFRVLTDGIYTTAMPSFRRFTDAQLHGLVDYVRLLAIRGETEVLLVDSYSPDEAFDLGTVRENYELVVDRWRVAPEFLIQFEGEVPQPTAERIEHGRALFTTPGEKGGANCVSCHGPAGRGDGPSVWEPGKEGLEFAKDEWGHPIQPRDLTRGVFRFGRRPIDLYRRIYAGINGTPMPEHFGMTITENGQQRTMTESDLWDLVFFVRTLSTHAPVASHGGGGHGKGSR